MIPREVLACLKECSNDLDEWLYQYYHGTLDYPDQRKKYNREMESVRRARALLQKYGDGTDACANG